MCSKLKMAGRLLEHTRQMKNAQIYPRDEKGSKNVSMLEKKGRDCEKVGQGAANHSGWCQERGDLHKSIVGNLADDKNSLTELAIAIGRVNRANIGEWLTFENLDGGEIRFTLDTGELRMRKVERNAGSVRF